MQKVTWLLLGIFLLGFSMLTALDPMRTWQPADARISQPLQQSLDQCRVLIVYDGDTLGCDMNSNHIIDGQFEHVRLLGIDSPEMHYSIKNKTGHDMPYAMEAKQLVETLTLHRTIYLEYDRIRLDKYHRTLAFVYLTPHARMLNALLLQKGLAQTMFIGENQKFDPLFLQEEQQAQVRHVGIWRS